MPRPLRPAIALSLTAFALLTPVSAHAAERPVISPLVQTHWTNQPAPTGTADVTVSVSAARRVSVTAAGHRWKLIRQPGRGSTRTWMGGIHNPRVTNYFARLSYTIRIKACNAAGCSTLAVRVRNQ